MLFKLQLAYSLFIHNLHQVSSSKTIDSNKIMQIIRWITTILLSSLVKDTLTFTESSHATLLITSSVTFIYLDCLNTFITLSRWDNYCLNSPSSYLCYILLECKSILKFILIYNPNTAKIPPILLFSLWDLSSNSGWRFSMIFCNILLLTLLIQSFIFWVIY